MHVRVGLVGARGVDDEDHLNDPVRHVVGVHGRLAALALVLCWHVFSELRDCSQRVGLVRHHEVGKGDRLINQLMILEARLVEEPSLPFVVPGSDW